jgi:hypothetical protein
MTDAEDRLRCWALGVETESVVDSMIRRIDAMAERRPGAHNRASEERVWTMDAHWHEVDAELLGRLAVASDTCSAPEWPRAYRGERAAIDRRLPPLFRSEELVEPRNALVRVWKAVRAEAGTHSLRGVPPHTP